MGFIKSFFSSIGKAIDSFLSKITDNPIVKKLIAVVGFFVLIFLLIILLASCGHKKSYTYEEFESYMVSLAKAKYKDANKLPQEDKGVLEVSLQSFVDNGQIKDIQSIIQDNATCTGYVKIINNNGYYVYIPYLDCGEKYVTKTLFDTLTNEDNITISGNGLYHNNNEYIFKGDNVNNYLTLNGIKYRIIKVNSDNTIRVIDTTKRDAEVWDDRYNSEKESSYGINNYVYNNINSRMKDYIEKLYNTESEFTEEMKGFFVTTPICIGKRSVNDSIFDTTIECSRTDKSFPFTLISPYEYYLATLDTKCDDIYNESCSNYNYFDNIGTTWTITGDKDTTYKVFKVSSSGAYLANASTSTRARIVTTLNGELVIDSGDGTSSNPYIIKSFIQVKNKK